MPLCARALGWASRARGEWCISVCAVCRLCPVLCERGLMYKVLTSNVFFLAKVVYSRQGQESHHLPPERHKAFGGIKLERARRSHIARGLTHGESRVGEIPILSPQHTRNMLCCINYLDPVPTRTTRVTHDPLAPHSPHPHLMCSNRCACICTMARGMRRLLALRRAPHVCMPNAHPGTRRRRAARHIELHCDLGTGTARPPELPQ